MRRAERVPTLRAYTKALRQVQAHKGKGETVMKATLAVKTRMPTP